MKKEKIADWTLEEENICSIALQKLILGPLGLRSYVLPDAPLNRFLLHQRHKFCSKSVFQA
jgi:hypothetical protein